jgi:uncharacterized metal-binding protein
MLSMRGALILDTKGTLILVLKNALLLDSCRGRRWGLGWLWYRFGRILGQRNRVESNKSRGKSSKDMLDKIAPD